MQVTKAWKDANNQNGKRLESVKIKLFADDKETDKTLILTKANNWTGTFTNLDQHKDGKEIIYTVEEERISGYTMTMAGDAKSGFVITNTKDVPKKPNKSTHTPKTGDSSNFLLYGSIAVVSLGAVLFLFGRRKKQR
ncbi:Cna B-type domain-containing protein [Clostridiaceae bacterium 68-1-5]|uniref:Cna B-type domain-containing protein n=1 Tax=Suipraeoptans intestinalis TaxID=2606628 RepID=A0A6N7V0F4_9FIRM|nr:Cna B-type domain-containing protein [Suipraeoptans intestinalis]